MSNNKITNDKIYNSYDAYHQSKDEMKSMLNYLNENNIVDKEEPKQRMSDDELIERIYGI